MVQLVDFLPSMQKDLSLIPQQYIKHIKQNSVRAQPVNPSWVSGSRRVKVKVIPSSIESLGPA